MGVVKFIRPLPHHIIETAFGPAETKGEGPGQRQQLGLGLVRVHPVEHQVTGEAQLHFTGVIVNVNTRFYYGCLLLLPIAINIINYEPKYR